MKANLQIFTVETLRELFSKGICIPEKMEDCIKELNEPRFQLREIGIGSKQIGDWRKGGLITEEFEKRKWREFSFLEALWIKFVAELRHFGMPLEDIKALKEALFPTKSKDIRKYLAMVASGQVPDYFKETQAKFKDALADDDIEKKIAVSDFSLFGSVIMIGLIVKLNIAFYFNRESSFFINLGKPVDEINAQKMEEGFKNIFRESFTIINFSSLIGKFFDNDKLVASSDFYFSIMDKDERDVMLAIRSGNYKQITIKMEGGSIFQLRLGKKQDDDLIKKISRILKKGDYKEIHLNVRDGIPVKLDVTDIVKIKNN